MPKDKKVDEDKIPEELEGKDVPEHITDGTDIVSEIFKRRGKDGRGKSKKGNRGGLQWDKKPAPEKE